MSQNDPKTTSLMTSLTKKKLLTDKLHALHDNNMQQLNLFDNYTFKFKSFLNNLPALLS